jgi:hypothetical protein
LKDKDHYSTSYDRPALLILMKNEGPQKSILCRPDLLLKAGQIMAILSGATPGRV